MASSEILKEVHLATDLERDKTMATEDGGQAYPSTETHPSWDYPLHHPGLSKREWFAGQALIGLLARGERPTEGVARDAYSYADAMISGGTQ